MTTEETEMKTIAERIQEGNIKMSCIHWYENPNMPDSDDMDHWKCTLRRPRKQMTVYFSMGYGHRGKAPELADVLDCLSSDAAGYENAPDFEDWAQEYGYDEDSRKAEKIYKTIEKQARQLKVFLGEELYTALLWETEKL